MGTTLENYLVEAAEQSADCRRARDLLLVGQQDWPVSLQDAKRHWRHFLELIGVADGLRPVPARMTRRGSPSYLWNGVLRDGKPTEGLDEDWCAEVARISLNHPYTDDYLMKGEAWRLPGQIEHEALPETVKEAFCFLVFEHLKTHGKTYFQFKVGRFERYQSHWDRQILPTPLATFLRSRSWIAASTQDGMAFRNSRDCWASRARRHWPPRFIDRVPEAMADFAEGEEFAELAFGETLRLRNWQSQETAVARLQVLASVSASLASNDRPTARKEYRRAWRHVVETGVSLPDDIALIATRRGHLEVIEGESDAPTNVFVTEDAQRSEARILSDVGQPVLEVGATSTKRIADLLKETGSYLSRRLTGPGTQLLVDGEPFVPRFSDSLLTSLGLNWLPEVIVIGHELRGEQLERGIQSSTVDRQARAIRVRHCKAMALVVDDEKVSLSKHSQCYAFPHETLPTLILNDSLTLDWLTLARSLSGRISRLIDGRLRSLEPLLLRLALDRSSDALDAPSDKALARALDCDVQRVQEHRAALRTNLEHVMHLLIPLVAYYAGTKLSQQLRREADHAGAKFDLHKWLQLRFSGKEHSPEELIGACKKAANRTELRRRLGLVYERFNRVLLDLGEPPLSNEAELRRLYGAYIDQMRPAIIERLRRRYAVDFRNGLDLTTYVDRKTLAFLKFDPQWILTRETLECEVVKAHVSRLLDEILGEDEEVDLPALHGLIERNRKSIRELFAAGAVSVVGAWCRCNHVSVAGALAEWRFPSRSATSGKRRFSRL